MCEHVCVRVWVTVEASSTLYKYIYLYTARRFWTETRDVQYVAFTSSPVKETLIWHNSPPFPYHAHSWHRCPMNRRPSKIKGGGGGPETTPGIGHGTGVVTASLLASWLPLSQWWSRRTGSWWGTGIVNRSHTAAVSGTSRSHMRPHCCDRACMSMVMCRLCIRAAACLSMIEGMWEHSVHSYARAHADMLTLTQCLKHTAGGQISWNTL